jgi:hypothetical protein
MNATYRGCKITKTPHGYVWDELAYGAESDTYFATIDEAKADIGRFFERGYGPVEVDGELYSHRPEFMGDSGWGS